MHDTTPFAFELIPGDKVTNAQFEKCATLFSESYGVWSSKVSAPLKPGARVKMNSNRLKKEVLGDPASSMLALCTLDGVHIGHAFATVWPYEGSYVCWVTQLVVASDYRELGIATTLLQLFPGPNFTCDALGIASTHTASCWALAKRAHKLDLKFIEARAKNILDASPVPYLKSGLLRGSLFQDNKDSDGDISSIYTGFYVDPDEPLRALRRWQEEKGMKWPLGDLAEGNEFLCIISNRQ
ncbi:hypothetical protein NLJ89_g10120 [Agrocybe chaxingu]|uniref:N-acetyltransferase domain-containing protein n=1 Tax=Agrocybe chaxingu TaxID=84603 RepID=A0A9W8MQK6_9AGAR|nr:hypothetical protein NLJ89_g10120 [Agrocybe chaxingu]